MFRTHGLVAGGLLALLLSASAQQYGQQQQHGGGDESSWAHAGEGGGGGGGHPQDLSAFPTVKPQDEIRADEGVIPLEVRPALRVVYEVFLNFSGKPFEQQQQEEQQKQQKQQEQQEQQQAASKGAGGQGTQLFKINIVNDGPGDVAQLATKIEGWNETTAWWGLDTLDGNNTYVYLPKYRSPLRPGDTWTFGMIQHTDRATFPLVEPLYGQTGDGRFFNLTSIIPSPPNPEGTNASLAVKDERETFYRGQRFVIFSGRITNSGSFPLVNVGLDIDNITQAAGTWHLIYDSATNTSYLPLREAPLRPGASQDFGFVMPLEGKGFPNVSLHHVTTPNALYHITAPNLFNDEKPREMAPPGNGTTTTLEESGGDVRVPYPPAHGRANATRGDQGQDYQEQQQEQQPEQQQTGAGNATTGNLGQEQQAGGGGNTTLPAKYLSGRSNGRRRTLRDV